MINIVGGGIGGDGKTHRIVDSVAEGIKTISTGHSAIHGGIGFGWFYQIESPIPYGTPVFVGFDTVADHYNHIKGYNVSAIGDGNLLITLFEGTNEQVTLDTNEKGFVCNMNLNSANAGGGIYGATLEVDESALRKVASFFLPLYSAENKTTNSGSYIISDYLENVLQPEYNYVLKFECRNTDKSVDFVGMSAFYYVEERGLENGAH